MSKKASNPPSPRVTVKPLLPPQPPPPFTTRNFLDDLYEHLKDPEYAVGYLQACLEEFDDAVLRQGLQNVAEVWKKKDDLDALLEGVTDDNKHGDEKL